MNRRQFIAGLLASAAVAPLTATVGDTLTMSDIHAAMLALARNGVPPLENGCYVCFTAAGARNTGPVTVNGLKMSRLGAFGRALYAGDLVAGRTYEVALNDY